MGKGWQRIGERKEEKEIILSIILVEKIVKSIITMQMTTNFAIEQPLSIALPHPIDGFRVFQTFGKRYLIFSSNP